MFATFNLQLMPTATLDAAPEKPLNLPVQGMAPVDIETSGFSRLLRFQTDTGRENAIPRGDFVPEGGNILPQAEPIPTLIETLPAIDVVVPLVADAGVATPVPAPVLGLTEPLADAPATEQAMLIPQVQQAIQTAEARPQETPRIDAEIKPQAPPQAVVARAVPELVVADAVKQTIPVDPGDSQLRELVQADRRDAVMPRSERPAVVPEVATAPRTIISPEAEVVARVTATADAPVAPDRSAPTSLPTPAISTLATAINQVASATPRDPGLVPQATLDLVRTPVTDPAWGERIGQRVVMMAGNQLQQAEIRLTPAELGPVRVQIAVEDGATNVTFHAQHAVTREAIEAAMPRLREMLAESGLSLGQASVGGDSVAEGQRERRETANSTPGRDAGAELTDESQPERQKTVTSDGLIDTFA